MQLFKYAQAATNSCINYRNIKFSHQFKEMETSTKKSQFNDYVNYFPIDEQYNALSIRT